MNALLTAGREPVSIRDFNSDILPVRTARTRAKALNFYSVRIPYLEYRHTVRGRSYRNFHLFYYDAGKRITETRSTFEALKKRAEEIARRISNGEVRMLTFQEAQRADYDHCINLTRETGQSLATICADAAEACRLWKGSRATEPMPTFAQLVRFYMEHRPSGFVSRTVPEVITEFLADKKGAIGSRWKRTLTSQLELFSEVFTGRIEDITGAMLNAWLRGLEVGPRTRNHYRQAADQLARWARNNGYLPRTWNEMERVPEASVKPVEFEIFTPAQTERLLRACESQKGEPLVPFVAINFFAGVRHEEIQKLDWSDINLKRATIYIRKGISKTGRDRSIPISANLIAWLKLHVKKSGPVCPLSNTSNALWKAKRRAELPCGKNESRNIGRKTFISNRLAIIKDIARVALEAGNSPQKIRDNYNRVPDEEDAIAHFAIMPKEKERQLPLPL